MMRSDRLSSSNRLLVAITTVVLGMVAGRALPVMASGQLDPSFGGTETGIVSNPSGSLDDIRAVAVDATGLYSVGYDVALGNWQWRIEKRDKTTGALLPSFGSGGVVTSNPTGATDQAYGLATDATALYIVGMENAADWHIEKRDKMTGALDPAFGVGGAITSNPSVGQDYAEAIAIDATSLYIVGREDEAAPNWKWRIEKRDKVTGALVTAFDGDGIVSSDPSVNDDTPSAVVLAGGAVYVVGLDQQAGGGQWRIEKRDAVTGALVPAFDGDGILVTDPGTSSDQPRAVAADATGLYVAGTDTSIVGNGQWRIEKRNLVTGALLSAFDGDGIVQSNPSGASDQPYALTLDGTALYVAGFDGITVNNEWRVEKRDKTTGALVPAFGSGGAVTSNPGINPDIPYAITVDTTGLYVAEMDTSLGAGNDQWRLEKYDPATGVRDPLFRTGTGVVTSNPGSGGEVSYVLGAYGGAIFVAGNDRNPGPLDERWRVEKRDEISGALVTAFDGDGVLTVNPSTNIVEEIQALHVDATGLYLGGADNTVDYAWRLEKRDVTTGALIPAFSGDGVVTVNPSAGTDKIEDMAADSSALYIAGYDIALGGVNVQGRVEKRDKTTGALVTAFDGDGIVLINPSANPDYVYGLALDATSLYVIGEDAALGSSNLQWRIEKRDKVSGALIPGFGSGGVVLSNPSGINDTPSAIVLDSTSLYVIGNDRVSTDAQWRIEKRNKISGALDASFGTGGVVTINPNDATDESGTEIALDSTGLFMGGEDVSGPNGVWRVEQRDKVTGAPVTAFGSGGVVTSNPSTLFDRITDLLVNPAALYVIGTDVSGPSSTTQWRIEKRLIPAELSGCRVEPSGAPYQNTTFIAIPEGASGNTTGFAFQWKRNGVNISGETEQRLLPQLAYGDTLTVECSAHDSLGNVGPVLTSGGVTLTNNPTTYSGATGNGLWNMVSVPLTSGNHLADNFTYLYNWNEVTQSYSGGTGGSKPSMTTGFGVWGYVLPGQQGDDGGHLMDATGTEVGGETFDVTGLTSTGGTFKGKHMLGSPFNQPVDFTGLEVRQAGSGSYIPIDQASANGWTEWNMWMRYDNVAGQYLPWISSAVNGRIFPWEGFWIHALVPIDVRFNVAQGPPPPPLASLPPSADDWTVTLSATAGVLRDDYNRFGVNNDASDGWDQNDATDGGTLNANHVVLRFPHLELAPDLQRLAHDIRATQSGGAVGTSEAPSYEWTAEVDAVKAGEITLAWGDLPDGQALTLTDTDTGETVPMTDGGSYRYWSRDTEVRAFLITASPISSGGGGSGSGDGGGAGGTPEPAQASASPGGCVAAPGGEGSLVWSAVMMVAALAMRRQR